MPHVVIHGPLTLEDIWLAYTHVDVTQKDIRFKTEGCYLEQDKKELLVRCLVVERGFAKKFFVRLHQRPDEITIKLEPLTDPEKTDGVRRLLGMFAERILTAEPEARVTQTNIQAFLRGEP
jgi:hypothetical protein